jgi:archaellum component FlaG (FlaF/FlaG flagellin family)
MVRRLVLMGMATATDTGIEAMAGIIVAGSIIGAMTTMIERLRHRARKHGDFTAAISVTTVTITNTGSEHRLPQLLTHFTN